MKWSRLLPAVLLTIMVTVGLTVGCEKEEFLPLGPKPPNDDKIIEFMLDAANGMNTYEYDLQTTATVTADDQEPNVTTMEAAAVVDAAGEKLFLTMVSEMSLPGFGTTSSEMYVIGDTMYMFSEREGSGIEGAWEKVTLKTEDYEQMWRSYNQAGQIGLLFEGIGEESVTIEEADGKYRLEVTVTMEQFATFLGATDEQIAQMMDDPDQMQLDDVEIIITIDSATYQPAGLDIAWSATSGGVTMTQSQTTTFSNIGQPVNINLPEEAADAEDITDMFYYDPSQDGPLFNDELLTVQIATIQALTEGGGTVVTYTNEIIPAGGKVGGVNDPGTYLIESTQNKYTITADGNAILGGTIQVPPGA
ncbi:MAG: DUF6612 family protein [Dehalogenimonas sp.]|uniref:DUF6612 family protein n=1 Tax=Candidatus Dehalogenimonas loeffleri TaxID=3127115 RepID=A0ABZ2J7M0_9CHLR|nr:DUF6612 family protein [Dehalogenimonas sp.]